MISSPEHAMGRRAWEYLRTAQIAPRPAGMCVVEYAGLPKKTRARKPKVRSGCISCKVRRVKCDEGKPTCQRCKEAKFKCDGYGNQPQHTSSNPIEIVTGVVRGRPLLARRNPWPVILDQQNVIYFDLFQTQLVYDLGGYSCSDFWSRIVLCESMTDECVLESVLAIGALSTAVMLASQVHNQTSLSQRPSALHPWTAKTMVNSHHKNAVYHYVKALSLFRSRVEAGTAVSSPRSILIMSMLFITFEMLQGDMKTVDGLITSSINLLKDTLKLHRQDARYNENIESRICVREEDDMEDIEHFLPLISIMGGHTPFLTSQSANIQLWDTTKGHDLPHTGQSNIGNLQTQWSKFCARTAAFIGRAMASHFQATTLPCGTADQQQVLIAQLNVWEAELNAWLTKSKAYGEAARRSLQVMEIQHLMLFICVSSCLDATQLAFDAHKAEFHKLLARCAIFLRDARPTYLFTLNTSILGALSITFVQCRVHNIRMMAAALLSQVSWREGAWDAALMMHGKLGGVLLEESARDEGGFIAPEHRWFWTGGEWDVERRTLTATYTRAVPDEGLMPVHTTLVLDLETSLNVCLDIGCLVDHATECEKLHTSVSVY